MSKLDDFSLDATLRQAIASHKAGQRADAEKAYRILLGVQPGHAEANHNLGVLMMQTGRIGEGVPYLGLALQSNDREPLYYLSYARGLLTAGDPAAAGTVLGRGQHLALGDKRFEVLRSQIQEASGHVPDMDPYVAASEHHRAGRLGEAEALYRKAIRARPDNLDAHEGLASALGARGAYDKAVLVYREALTVSPDNPVLLDNLGSSLHAIGQMDEAIACYKQALALDPDFADAHFHLGTALSETGSIAEGFQHYMRRAALVYGTGKAPATEKPDPQHKVQHDLEQRDYLAGGKAASAAPLVADMFQLADGSRINGPAVNPLNATPGLVEAWGQSWPQLVVIDNFLTAPALEKLRAYCAGSTIWRKIYSAGYLGAAPEDGFSCPLLAQIVEEVQTTFASILNNEKFQYLGAFKYDSVNCAGTNTHADNSALNVNFYIAPDEANLDPAHGGMEIWDVGVPDVEAQRKYSSSETAIHEFLKRSSAKSTIIPHRANRAVIFKSALIHRTDTFTFKTDYLSRRINISLLFGNLA